MKTVGLILIVVGALVALYLVCWLVILVWAVIADKES